MIRENLLSQQITSSSSRPRFVLAWRNWVGWAHYDALLMRIGLGVRWAPVLSLGGVGMGALLVRSGFGYWVSWIMCHHGRLPPPICQLLPHNRPCTTTTSAPCARTSPIFGGLVIAIDKQEVNLVTDDEELLIISFIESNALLVRVGRCSPRLLVRMVSQITCRLGSDGVVVPQAFLLL